MQMIWLQAFVAVAKKLNFSDAAEDIYVSQSSLSKYIQMVEKTLGVGLIDRSHRQISLTPAGVQFYRYAVDILSQYDEMLRCMQNYTEQKKRRVQLVFVAGAHLYGYTRIFMDYFKENKEISFSMQDMEMGDALLAFETGEADFAVVRTNLVPNLEEYREIRFNVENMYILCSRRSKYARMQSVSLGDILDEKMVMQRFAVDELKMMFRKYYSPNVEIKPNLVSTRQVMIHEYISNNIGISIVSRSLARIIDPGEELALIPITEEPVMTMGMLMRKSHLTEACKDFANYVQMRIGGAQGVDNRQILRELEE